MAWFYSLGYSVRNSKKIRGIVHCFCHRIVMTHHGGFFSTLRCVSCSITRYSLFMPHRCPKNRFKIVLRDVVKMRDCTEGMVTLEERSLLGRGVEFIRHCDTGYRCGWENWPRRVPRRAGKMTNWAATTPMTTITNVRSGIFFIFCAMACRASRISADVDNKSDGL